MADQVNELPAGLRSSLVRDSVLTRYGSLRQGPRRHKTRNMKGAEAPKTREPLKVGAA